MAGRQKENDGASPAKIFIGGLPRETREDEFRDNFGKYGKIIDAVIMKERHTNKPRGFGFITYDDPSVVDRVIEDTHTFHGKQVEIKRTIPKGASSQMNFKTKKVFVGGLPVDLKDDDFKEFFSKFGKISNHEIIRDHNTNRSRGFGFVIFDSENTVDDLLAKKGNKIDLNGTEVEIKKAEPKKSSSSYNPPPRPHSFDRPQSRQFKDSFDRYGPYSSRPDPFRRSPPSSYGGFRPGPIAAYGGGPPSEFYSNNYSRDYATRYGSYGGSGFGNGYDGDVGGFGSGSGSGFGGDGYYSSSSSFSGGGYGSRGGGPGSGSGSSRYHPYGR